MSQANAAVGLTSKPFAVVTGASEGIGLAFAWRLARLGRDLVLVARNEPALVSAAGAIAERHRVSVIPLALDLTVPGAGQRLDQCLTEAGGHVDMLVNNAGIGLSGRFDEMPPASIQALIDLNITAVTALSRHVLPGMRSRRRGGIINIASLGGYVPGPWQAAYYASKAYVIALSEALAAEAAADNVRVMVVAPGPVLTRFHAKMGAQASLYRLLLPAPGPDTIAWRAIAGYRLGLRVVIPDVWSLAAFPFLRFSPHRLLIPIVSWLLKPRRQEGE